MDLENRLASALGAGIVAILALAVAIVFLPVVQTIGYRLLVASPALPYWLLIGAIGFGALHYTGHPNAASGVGAVALIMAFLIGPFMSGVYAQEHILATQEFEQRAELPETSVTHVRVLPRNVANQYAESANQLPKYRTGDADIAYHDGNYTWSYGVVPDRLFVAWQGNQWGAYYVDMEQTGRSVTTSKTTMTYGMGMLVFDSYGYQFNVERLDVAHKPETAFVFEDDGETHIAQSYVTHDWHFRLFPIPQPYAVPEYGGTLVVGPEGTIEDYSPQEVADSPLFEGQNTYPYDLARFRMKSMQLREGLLNKFFIGKNVPEIADTGGFSDNEQPFTVPTPTDDGSPELTYYIAATPAGSGSGIYQIYTIDAQTGAIEYVTFDETQAGPKKAAGYTRSQNRAPNWAANNEDGSTQITEPIPIVLDNTLYWHMRVTPTDGARVSYTTFVNADTGTVYRADTTAEILSFIESGGTSTVEPDPGQNESESGGQVGPDTTITVAVIEDGNVVRTVTVDPDQEIVISADNGTRSTPTPTPSTATATG